MTRYAAFLRGVNVGGVTLKMADVVYWQVPKGAMLTSTIGATMGKRRYKQSTTTRNLRTLGKVLRG